MPTITFIHPNGSEYRTQAEVGQSLMQAALNNQVPGVLGDCGGNCACATCHGYIDANWARQLPKPQPLEKDMIHCAIEVNEHSRLMCQIIVSPELDGMQVRLPTAQN